MRAWFLASVVAAVVAVGFAMEARSAQLQPGGAIPYQSNNHAAYLTNAPVAGHGRPVTVATAPSPSFRCVHSPMGPRAIRNPGTAGPALTGNMNNCAQAPH